MRNLFYQSFTGTSVYGGELNKKSFNNAITMHPLKNPEYLYRMHVHIKIMDFTANTKLLEQSHRNLITLNIMIDKGN